MAQIYGFVSDPQNWHFGILTGLAWLLASGVAIGLFARLKAKLQQQKLRLDTALENMSQGLCMHNADGRIIMFNERYCKMTGRSAASLKDRHLLDVFKERKVLGDFVGDPEIYFADLISKIRAGKSNSFIWHGAADRTYHVVDEPMRDGGWVSTVEDISDWREAQKKIEHMARHDSLTNLPNRRHFSEQLELALQRLSRKQQIAVLCIDLDHFKDVNDTLGHPVGDEVLKEVSDRLSMCVRKSDTVARLGGDEFVILLAGENLQPTDVSAMASRIVEVVGMPYEIDEQKIIIGASIGISMAPQDGKEADQLLQNADMALYRAKSDGRGTCRYFEPGMDASAQARRILTLDLRAALLREEFEVYYQPIYDLKTNKITSFEALVRWNHPIRGMMPPAAFIPLAEETGLIVPLGEWVLRKACQDAAQWSEAVDLAVNLSPAQFKNRDLVSSIIEAVTAAALSPRRLEVEITESVLIQDHEAALSALHQLRNFGVRISMDDFGTGYSSLSNLRSFPFDKVKIDQSFVQEMELQDDSMAIVRAITALGKSLGITTTAEGVETSEQLNLLRLEGCAQVQGYLFSRPQPASVVEELLLHNQVSEQRELKAG